MIEIKVMRKARVFYHLAGLINGAVSLVVFGATVQAAAAEVTWESLGTRAGFSITRRAFVQSELFTRWNLPWQWRTGTNWNTSIKLDLSAGCLSGRQENGFVGTLGPCVVLQLGKSPLYLDAGVSPTLLSRAGYDNRDFAIPFQFTSHVGLDWKIKPHWKMGYRYQHMSNAGLGMPNPGLNINMLSVSYLW